MPKMSSLTQFEYLVLFYVLSFSAKISQFLELKHDGESFHDQILKTLKIIFSSNSHIYHTTLMISFWPNDFKQVQVFFYKSFHSLAFRSEGKGSKGMDQRDGTGRPSLGLLGRCSSKCVPWTAEDSLHYRLWTQKVSESNI